MPRQAQQSVKAAADRYKSTERDHGRRVEAAERDLAKASENPKLIGVGGVLGNKAVLRETTIKGRDEIDGRTPADSIAL